ncbi:MAG: Crp/Fnr family transcriptional regulator [Aquabacterium sp.]
MMRRGREVFHAGQACEGLYMVLEGGVKSYARLVQGQEKVIEVVGEGACVAEALVFSEDAHGVHARALSDAHILLVPRRRRPREIEHSPGLAVRLLAGVARQLNGLLRDIEAVTLHSGRAKGRGLFDAGLGAGAGRDRVAASQQGHDRVAAVGHAGALFPHPA